MPKKIWDTNKKPIKTAVKIIKIPKEPSQGEQMLALDFSVWGIEYTPQYKFHPTRKWKSDFHIKPHLLIEVEGGVYSNGRHTRGKGYTLDIEKYNAATLMDFKVFRFTTEQVKTGVAISTIMQALGRVM